MGDAVGEHYINDGVLDDAEMQALGDLDTALQVAGLSHGDEIQEKHATMMIGTGLALGAAFIRKERAYSTATLPASSKAYRERARELLAVGKHDDALRALSYAIAIDDKHQKWDREAAGVALTRDLETMMRVLQSAGKEGPFLDAMRALSAIDLDHAQAARLFGTALLSRPYMDDFVSDLPQLIDAAKALVRLGVRPGEKLIVELKALMSRNHVGSFAPMLFASRSSVDETKAIIATFDSVNGWLPWSDRAALIRLGPTTASEMNELIESLGKDGQQLRFMVSLVQAMPAARALELTKLMFAGSKPVDNEAYTLITALNDRPELEILAWVEAVRETKASFRYAASIVRAGVTNLQDVKKLCAKSNAVHGFWQWQDAADAMHKAGFAPEETLEFISKLMRKPHAQGSEVATVAILKLAKAQNADKALTFKALAFVFQYGGNCAREVGALLADCGVDLHDLRHDKIVAALAPKIKPEHALNASSMLNALHEGELRERGTDKIRAEMIKLMPPEVTYAIIGAGSDALFTSTYLLLIERLKATAGGVRQWLGDNPKDYAAFFATLTRFGQMDVLLDTADLAVGVIESDFSNTADLVSKASRDVKMVVEILRKGDPVLCARIEKRLLDHREVPAVAFMLRQAFQANVLQGKEAIAVAERYPPIVGNAPPTKRWLADGTVSAKLFYFPDERSFEESITFFTNAGFSVSGDKKKQAVLERTYKGTKVRLVLSKDPEEERESAFDSKRFDIVAARCHSFHFHQVFVPTAKPDDDNPQLLFGGSCGSFRSMTSPGFLETYGRQLHMSDQNTGEGPVNDQVILRTVFGIAEGKTKWADFGYDKIGNKGLVLPDDPAHLAHAYAVSFEQWLAAKKKSAST